MPLTRAVRHRYSLLTTKQAQNLRDQEKASGIHVEISELDTLLEEMLEREKDGKAKIESQDLDKNKKAGKEKTTAEEARKQAMERMADTKKRENDESDSGNGRKKVRRSTSDTIDFLKEKSAKDHDLKEKDIELRKRELELAADKHTQAAQQQNSMMRAFMSQMQEQQQSLQAMLITQQQQQNKILMALMENKKKEWLFQCNTC